MIEPQQLRSAREHLSLAEAQYRSEDGLFHLGEALALLDEVMAGGPPPLQVVARNLAMTYANRICSGINARVQADRGLPEPELEHLFRVMLAFDERGFELPDHARATKIYLVRRLIDRYHEGHAPAAKARALEELARITQDEKPQGGARRRSRRR